MPSKRDPCLVAGPEVQRDFLARDVEELVSEIKENLRLKARPRRTQPRPTPYERPRPAETGTKAQPEDPYEMLQQLLDSNSLVAEAVRRLREGLCPKRRYMYEDDEEVSLIYPLPY
jgi:hypothetical protein